MALNQISLEFLVRPHGVFIGGYLSAPLAVVKVLKKLDLRCVQAATAFTGGPVERTGPDFRRVSGMRRKASKFRKHAASASLTRVRVAAGRQPPRRIRACGSALAVSRTSRVRAIWTRWSQRSRVVRPRCHMAPRPSTILRSRNRGSMLHLLEYASTMAGADSVGSVDSSRRTLAQPEPFANSHHGR